MAPYSEFRREGRIARIETRAPNAVIERPVRRALGMPPTGRRKDVAHDAQRDLARGAQERLRK